MGFPGLDTATTSYARHRDFEDAWYRVNSVLREGNDGVFPAMLVLAVCDPNDRNEDHLMIVARVTAAVHLVSSTAMGLENDHWRRAPFGSLWALVHSQCM